MSSSIKLILLALLPPTAAWVARLRASPPLVTSIRMNIVEQFQEEMRRSKRFRDASGDAAGLVELPVMFGTMDEADDFDFGRWDRHRSADRYSRLLVGTFFGSTTTRVIPAVAALTAFSALVSLYNTGLVPSLSGGLPELQLPITPFELTAPILGLLLVFRTDTANDRFTLGSESAWEITASFRSYMRRLVAWTSTTVSADTERAAVDELLTSCVLLHGWIMGSYLQGERTRAAEAAGEAQLVSTDPILRGAGVDVPSARLTPSQAMTALAIGTAQRVPSLSDQERVGLDDELDKVTAALARAERILRTPIPLGYTRYAVRFLWLWLTLLPFALVRTFADFGVSTWWEGKPQPVLVIAMLFIGFIFLSIEDIAVQIEEPFAILPLERLQLSLERDAEQMRRLMRSADASRRAGGDGVS